MAMNVAEADAMIGAARAVGRQLFVHQNMRFGRAFTFMTDTIASGKLGKIYHVAMCSHLYNLRTDWQTVAAHGGGELGNAGSHALDVMLRLLGAPVKDVYCDLKHIADSGDAEDTVKVLLRAENGVTGDLEIFTKAATTLHAPQWTILGDAGAMTIESRDTRKAHLKYYDRSQVAPLKPQGTLAATARKYTPLPNLPWKEEDVVAEGHDPGTYYEAVYRTIRLGEPFRVQAGEVRQVIDVIGRCRAQNPGFPGVLG
jgi:predicted dehydrogenase